MSLHILRQAVLGIGLAAGAPLWSQVNPAPDSTTAPAMPNVAPATSDTTAAPAIVDDRMQTPPPVSGTAYPTSYVSEARSNYLRAGIIFSTAYSDNVFTNASGSPESDVSYSVFPSVALDQTTPRLHWGLSYAPGFTFYGRDSSANQANQNLSVSLRYRLSQHVTLSLGDSFQKSSSLLDQPGLVAVAPVTGSAQGPGIAIVAPLADQLTNVGNVELTYQFSANGMVGASGTFSNLHFGNSAQVPGLYDSSTQGGSVFYSHRLTKKHYVGANYQYQRILAYPVNAQSETQTQSIVAFYTFYPQPKLSFSVSGGPQYANVDQSPLPAAKSWSPTVTVSMGWQARRTSLAASYSRVVSGGGGLLGAFHSNSVGVTLRQQISRNWNAQALGAYSINKTVTPFFFLASPGGHTVSGSASIQRQLGQHLNVDAGYMRLHQSYSGIAVISTAPDTNREYLTISYQFARPLGR